MFCATLKTSLERRATIIFGILKLMMTDLHKFNNNNNNKQFSIPLRQIFTSKKWLHQSGSGIISVNKINTSSGLADTNKDKKHAKHQNYKCTNIYKRKKTKHKSKYIQTKATVLLTFNKYYLI